MDADLGGGALAQHDHGGAGIDHEVEAAAVDAGLGLEMAVAVGVERHAAAAVADRPAPRGFRLHGGGARVLADGAVGIARAIASDDQHRNGEDENGTHGRRGPGLREPRTPLAKAILTVRWYL